MKSKQLVAMAALALLVALPARAAEVVSSNIVGYEKITVPVNAQDIVGVQFQNIGANGTINLQDIVPEKGENGEGYSGEGVDWIKIYDPATSRYTTAYFWGVEADGGVYESADAEEALGPGWGDEQQNVIDVDLLAGQGVWTQSKAGGKLVVAGEVTAGTSVTVPVNVMTLASNPLPMTVALQQIVPTGYSGEGVDWIKIYNPSTSRYVTAYYWGEEADGGVYENADAEEALGPGWGDEQQNVINVDITIGQGFWTQAKTGGTLTFPAIPAE